MCVYIYIYIYLYTHRQKRPAQVLPCRAFLCARETKCQPVTGLPPPNVALMPYPPRDKSVYIYIYIFIYIYIWWLGRKMQRDKVFTAFCLQAARKFSPASPPIVLPWGIAWNIQWDNINFSIPLLCPARIAAEAVQFQAMLPFAGAKSLENLFG